MWRIEEYDRSGFQGKLLKPFFSIFGPRWREPCEDELLRRIARCGKARENRARAGNRYNGYVLLNRGGNQPLPGVTHEGGPGVRHNRDIAAFGERFQERRDLPGLVMFVKAGRGSRDSEMPQEKSSPAGIFGGDHRDRFERVYGAHRHVVQIPDGSGHDVQAAGHDLGGVSVSRPTRVLYHCGLSEFAITELGFELLPK